MPASPEDYVGAPSTLIFTQPSCGGRQGLILSVGFFFPRSAICRTLLYPFGSCSPFLMGTNVFQ